ncbi:MAG: hypothetical protein AMXMBFR13_22380 [Phycisphaerae bacterium]
MTTVPTTIRPVYRERPGVPVCWICGSPPRRRFPIDKCTVCRRRVCSLDLIGNRCRCCAASLGGES